jgi:hypothetical protein
MTKLEELKATYDNAVTLLNEFDSKHKSIFSQRKKLKKSLEKANTAYQEVLHELKPDFPFEDLNVGNFEEISSELDGEGEITLELLIESGFDIEKYKDLVGWKISTDSSGWVKFI